MVVASLDLSGTPTTPSAEDPEYVSVDKSFSVLLMSEPDLWFLTTRARFKDQVFVTQRRDKEQATLFESGVKPYPLSVLQPKE